MNTLRISVAGAESRGSGALVVVGALAVAAAVTSAVIWVMHLSASSLGVPEYSKAVTASRALAVPETAASRDAVTRLFGAAAPAPTAGLRESEMEGVQLLGIVSDRRGAGVALFSVEGAPPVRVRVGARVRDGVTLTEIHRRHVVLTQGLSQGARTVELGLAARSQVAAGDVRPRGAAAGVVTAPVIATPAPATR